MKMFSFVIVGLMLGLAPKANSSIICEMYSINNPENKITAVIEKVENDYGYADSNDGIDGLYWFSMDVQEGDLNVTITDDNDEVGSFGCSLTEVEQGQCLEPIYDEENVYRYDIKCVIK